MSRDNRLLTLALFLWGIGEGLFWDFQPLYLRELGADALTIGSILGVAGLVAAFTHAPAGYLADWLGRKTVMLAGWVLGVLACLGMYLATNLTTFTLAWVAYMFTAFALTPINAYALFARGTASIERTLTLVWAGFFLGMLISPALGGWVASQFGLRQIYGLGTLIFVVSTGIIALIQAQPTGLDPNAAPHRPAPPSPALLCFAGLSFAVMTCLTTGIHFAPNFLQDVRQVDVVWIGLLGSVNALGITVFNVTLGRLAPRWGALVGMAAMVLSLGLLLGSAHPVGLGLAYFLRAGMNFTKVMLIAHVGQRVSHARNGLTFGIIETAIQLAHAPAPIVAGWLYATNPTLPFGAALVGLVLIMPLVWRELKRPQWLDSAPQNTYT